MPDNEVEKIVCEDIVEPTDGCNLMATGEGSGGYDAQNDKTTAAGRYQFVDKTAAYTLTGMGRASSTEEALELWSNCKNSTEPECKQLQDEMCNWYFNDTLSQMSHYGVAPTKFNMYLAWNQGAMGASKIIEAAKNNEQVTDETVKRNMRGQQFFSGDESNNYDGQLFLDEMESYLERQNYPGI